MDPIIKTILKYQPPGRKIVTHYHTEGVRVQTRIIPLIADLPAAREAGGFLSHSAIQYCWFCLLTKDENARLDHERWHYRTGEQVRKDAKEWKKLETLKARNQKAKETGVRFASLHLQPFWDPVKHTILGFMHNWLEGVLENHLRVLWGIGRTIQKAKQLIEIQDYEDLDEEDVERTGSEISSLLNDNLDDPAELESLRSSLASFGPATPVPSSIDFDREEDWEDEDEDMDDATEYGDTAVYGNFTVPTDALDKIRKCIKEVSLPTWVTRLPENLGEKKHGKLKAEQFLTLFSAILPLVVPELELTEDHAINREMLDGFYNLTASTNIISSFETSDSEAAAFTEHYVAYRKHVQKTYPDCPEPPNGHYAMHNEPIMKYWGPVAGLNEFWGERMNGMLQRIKTNRHLYDMDLTMLRQMARRCRLMAYLHNSEFTDPQLKAFADILDVKDTTKPKKPEELDGFAVARYLYKAPKMTSKEYKSILSYLNSSGEGCVYPDLTEPVRTHVVHTPVRHNCLCSVSSVICRRVLFVGPILIWRVASALVFDGTAVSYCTGALAISPCPWAICCASYIRIALCTVRNSCHLSRRTVFIGPVLSRRIVFDRHVLRVGRVLVFGGPAPIPFVPRSGPLAIPGSSSTGASSATCTSSASAPSSSTTGPPPLLVASAPSQPRYAPEAVPLVSPSIPLLVPDILKPSTKGQQTPRADKKTKQETRKRKNVENWDEQGKVVRSDTLAPEETGRKKKRARMDAPTEEDVTIVCPFFALFLQSALSV
ncbi:hypothetical protein C8R46DRAFT_1234485 [Mycena filopes]|nr:hypothetical protein C8R46DRAFT_1234485 [Mycena filopes]